MWLLVPWVREEGEWGACSGGSVEDLEEQREIMGWGTKEKGLQKIYFKYIYTHTECVKWSSKRINHNAEWGGKKPHTHR